MKDVYQLQILAQIIEAMNECAEKLEKYYEARDIENFNKSKKTLLELQQQASEALK